MLQELLRNAIEEAFHEVSEIREYAEGTEEEASKAEEIGNDLVKVYEKHYGDF